MALAGERHVERCQAFPCPAGENARVEHDKALGRVMTGLIKDDTELFRQFTDNDSFRRWLTDTVFRMTYSEQVPAS